MATEHYTPEHIINPPWKGTTSWATLSRSSLLDQTFDIVCISLNVTIYSKFHYFPYWLFYQNECYHRMLNFKFMDQFLKLKRFFLLWIIPLICNFNSSWLKLQSLYIYMKKNLLYTYEVSEREFHSRFKNFILISFFEKFKLLLLN